MSIAYLQTAQLAVLNWQIANQRRNHVVQGNMHQVLHDTEQMARRATATEEKDSFAAAIIATSWLRRVHGISATQFYDIATKRAWTEAWETLDRVVQEERSGNAQALDAYFAHSQTMHAYSERLRFDPRPQLDSEYRKINTTLPLLVAGVIAGLSLMFLVLMIAANGAKAIGGVLCLSILPAALISCCLWWWHGVNQRRRKIQSQLAIAQGDINTFERFLADPTAGAWLRKVWEEHPLIFNAIAPEGPMSKRAAPASQQIERHVVERQIVVVRCRFCTKLTPVDRATCESCGADGFGGAR